MKADSSDALVGSRLVILKSKRLMLASAERRLNVSGSTVLGERVQRLRQETQAAHSVYRSTLVKRGSPKHPGYWPAVYSRLVDVGRRLTDRLRSAPDGLSPAERYEVAAEVEMLE